VLGGSRGKDAWHWQCEKPPSAALDCPLTFSHVPLQLPRYAKRKPAKGGGGGGRPAAAAAAADDGDDDSDTEDWEEEGDDNDDVSAASRRRQQQQQLPSKQQHSGRGNNNSRQAAPAARQPGGGSDTSFTAAGAAIPAGDAPTGVYSDEVAASLHVVDPSLINYDLIEALLVHIARQQGKNGPTALLQVSEPGGLGGEGLCCLVACLATQHCVPQPPLLPGLAGSAPWRAGGSSRCRWWWAAGVCAHLHAWCTRD
jgi:hypothetical protein